MRRYLIATHGRFAEGIRGAAELIIGEQENLDTLCCYLTDDFDLETAIQSHLGRMAAGDELVVMTDVAGGSVNKGFMLHLNHPGLHLVTGLNLALALTLLSSDGDEPVEAAIAEAVREAKSGVIYCNSLSGGDGQDDDF